VGTLADKRKRRHGENTLKTEKLNLASILISGELLWRGRDREKRKWQKSNYSQEHDFLVCPALFPISLHSLIVSSHASQVALSLILQVMNNSDSCIFLLPTAANQRLAKNRGSMRFTEVDRLLPKISTTTIYFLSTFGHKLLINKQGLKPIITINFSVNK